MLLIDHVVFHCLAVDSRLILTRHKFEFMNYLRACLLCVDKESLHFQKVTVSVLLPCAHNCKTAVFEHLWPHGIKIFHLFLSRSASWPLSPPAPGCTVLICSVLPSCCTSLPRICRLLPTVYRPHVWLKRCSFCEAYRSSILCFLLSKHLQPHWSAQDTGVANCKLCQVWVLTSASRVLVLSALPQGISVGQKQPCVQKSLS